MIDRNIKLYIYTILSHGIKHYSSSNHCAWRTTRRRRSRGKASGIIAVRLESGEWPLRAAGTARLFGWRKRGLCRWGWWGMQWWQLFYGCRSGLLGWSRSWNDASSPKKQQPDTDLGEKHIVSHLASTNAFSPGFYASNSFTVMRIKSSCRLSPWPILERKYAPIVE